jgi:hypothetical protein
VKCGILSAEKEYERNKIKEHIYPNKLRYQGQDKKE